MLLFNTFPEAFSVSPQYSVVTVSISVIYFFPLGVYCDPFYASNVVYLVNWFLGSISWSEVTGLKSMNVLQLLKYIACCFTTLTALLESCQIRPDPCYSQTSSSPTFPLDPRVGAQWVPLSRQQARLTS